MFSLAGKVETYERVKGKIPVVSQHNKLFKFVSAVQKLHHYSAISYCCKE